MHRLHFGAAPNFSSFFFFGFAVVGCCAGAGETAAVSVSASAAVAVAVVGRPAAITVGVGAVEAAWLLLLVGR